MLFIIDFDGTITLKDTVDELLKAHADPVWEVLEKDWVEGRITAKECMSQQISLIKATQQELDRFIDALEVDPDFIAFFDQVKSFADLIVVSDGLDYVIRKVFKDKIKRDVTIYANHLEFESNGYRLEFPHYKVDCLTQQGMCKCSVSASYTRPWVMVGDGRSDLCIANHSDFVFAKGFLKKYCLDHQIPCKTFNHFSDIIEYLNTNELVCNGEAKPSLC